MLPNAVDYYSSGAVPPQTYFDWWNHLDKKHLPVSRMIEMLLREGAQGNTFTPETLVDLGCGPGTSFPIMAKQFGFKKVFAIDAAPPMLQYVEDRRLNYPFEILLSLRNLEREPLLINANSINVAMSCSTIGYIKNLENVFKEVSRILVPSGFWTFDCQLHNTSFDTLEDDSDATLSYIHSLGFLKALSQGFGFTPIGSVQIHDEIVHGIVTAQFVILFQKNSACAT